MDARRPPVAAAALFATALLSAVAACTGSAPAPRAVSDEPVMLNPQASTTPSDRSVLPAASADEPAPPAVVVSDPGHNGGNASTPGEINRPVPAGGFTKPGSIWPGFQPCSSNAPTCGISRTRQTSSTRSGVSVRPQGSPPV
jgi:hypothetical protein